MSENRCACGKPAGDAEVCKRCTAELRDRLEAIPDLAQDLELSITRQTVLGQGGGIPVVPWDERAALAQDELRTALAGWVRLLVGEQWPDDTIPAMARWLTARLNAIRQHEAGYEAVIDIGAAVRRARHTIDRPHDRSRFAIGPCPQRDEDGQSCSGTVWAHIPTAREEAARLQCRTCETRWETHQWIRVGRRILRKMNRSA